MRRMRVPAFVRAFESVKHVAVLESSGSLWNTDTIDGNIAVAYL